MTRWDAVSSGTIGSHVRLEQPAVMSNSSGGGRAVRSWQT